MGNNETMRQYQQGFKDAAQKYGVEYSEDIWNKFYNHFQSSQNFNAAWKEVISPYLAGELKKQYNTKAKEYADLTGDKFEPYSAQWSNDPETIFSSLGELASKADYATTNKEKEPPKYKFDLYEKDENGNYKYQEWIDLEENAKKSLGEKAPEMNPDLVGEWEGKLDPIYARQRENTTRNARDAWGMMFEQGGGSTYEANKLAKALTDIDLEKLDKAIQFAEVEHGRKYATWQANQDSAKNTLSGIGKFKADAGQFGSELDARNFWNKYAADAAERSAENTARINAGQWEKEASLAESLAKIQADANKTDPWLDIAKSILSGASSGLSMGLSMPKPK